MASAVAQYGAGGVEHTADVVDDDVHAVGGQRPDAVGDAVAVGHRLGPQLAQPVVVALGGGADDAGAQGPRDLYAERAHAARRAVHEHRVAPAGAEPGERSAAR